MKHRYMLDTNTVSHILRHRPETIQYVQRYAFDVLCILFALPTQNCGAVHLSGFIGVPTATLDTVDCPRQSTS